MLYPEICECRVFKSEAELRVMRYVNQVSSEAHKEIMRRIRPGWMEYQAERFVVCLNYYLCPVTS